MTDKKFKKILQDYEENRKKDNDEYNFYRLNGWFLANIKREKLTINAKQYDILTHLQIYDNSYEEFLKVIK